ncbi:MAG: hypothetical protein ACHQWU_13265 [Gemmatimonadales bacterium]
MRLDRKLLLIAPAIVLLFVAGGVAYTAYQLHYLVDSAASWRSRSDFIAAVARGQKPFSEKQAVNILQASLEFEAKRTAAINASRSLLFELSAIAFLSCGVLALGIRSVPREHWPRFQFGRAPDV